jgi:hypothetical protein
MWAQASGGRRARPTPSRFIRLCSVEGGTPRIAAERGGHRELEVDYDGRIVPMLVRCAQVPNAPG